MVIAKKMIVAAACHLLSDSFYLCDTLPINKHFLFIFSSAEVEGVDCDGLITLPYVGEVGNQIVCKRAVDSSTDHTFVISEFNLNKIVRFCVSFPYTVHP